MASASSCAHCGLPVPPSRRPERDEPGFCCRGCETVWALVHEAGLTDYYRLRSRLGEDQVPGRAQAPHAAEAPAFAHFDDPEVLAELQIGGREGSAALRCTGMHCAACVWLIERLPQTLDGLDRARVDLGSGQLELDWDPERVSLSHIAARLHEAGYEVHRVDAEAEAARRAERRRELMRLAVTGASAGNVMLVSFALYAGALSGMEASWQRFFEYAALILALPAVTYGAAPFYRGAWAGLRAKTLHIDLPVALGVLGGFVASALATTGLAPGLAGGVYFDTVSVLVFLLLIGRRVQSRGQQWALSQTDLLSLLVPEQARRIDPGGARSACASAALVTGERIEVLAGERVPADAKLVRGAGSVDARSLTGEAQPLAVELGDLVLAGTTLVEGTLELEVRAVGAETRVGSLAAQIMKAGRERAPIQHAVDRISGIFVATVLGLALVGGLVWSQLDPSRALAVVVSLLVISCPCALGLATPVALAVARAQAARRGILVGSAAALETLARAERVVFDKTGTLTRGEPSVRSVACTGALDESELASLLLAIEAGSGHPLAQALRRWADPRALGQPTELADIVDEPGRGRRALIHPSSQSAALPGVRQALATPASVKRPSEVAHGVSPRAARSLRVGSLGWIEAQGCFAAELDALLARGETPVLVELEGRPRALFGLADTLHADAHASLDRLRALGLGLAIRSGDHPAAVRELARTLGIADFAGAMTPEAKAEELTSSGGGRPSVMVGDGVNDAAAMRRAPVGVAVRGGSEVALRSADVHLTGEGLGPVVELFEGARRTMRVIRRNLTFSLLYNLSFAGLALCGLINPLAAALLMPASSLTVVLSSTLARTFGGSGAEPSAPVPHASAADFSPATAPLGDQVIV